MEEFMDNQYTISIIEVISDGKLNIHEFGEYHFKANVYCRKHNFGKCDVYMIKDLPTIHKMSQFNYNFENRTIDVIMEKSDNNSFTINEILSIEKNPPN
ncbi:hypothetical protein E4O04_12810 [Treponema sp. OMZ 799]|uniref:hypothetical protein n=1 Tax=Treponema sp. OMZ 799 TaxID=2563668 RepID=UPI0020A42F9C|nr:hypothetical protein [Treponema sp. OMZ 799]UTC78830.1 hypothetical protein E4O04_12810 [Treponema sp. OMZ 799]